LVQLNEHLESQSAKENKIPFFVNKENFFTIVDGIVDEKCRLVACLGNFL
jgi:hypothetical protein